jgi:hypothetical protein
MPQHERGDHLGPVRQVHLGGTLMASSRAATSGLAVLPAAFTWPPNVAALIRRDVTDDLSDGQ